MDGWTSILLVYLKTAKFHYVSQTKNKLRIQDVLVLPPRTQPQTLTAARKPWQSPGFLLAPDLIWEMLRYVGLCSPDTLIQSPEFSHQFCGSFVLIAAQVVHRLYGLGSRLQLVFIDVDSFVLGSNKEKGKIRQIKFTVNHFIEVI